MTDRRLLARLVGFSLVVVTMALVAIGYWSVRRDIDAMRRAGRENILWSATQLQVELLRFQHSLADFAAPGGSDPAAVNERFDILWSRIGLFREGPTGRRLRAYDREGTVDALFDTVRAVEPEVLGLQSGDGAAARRKAGDGR